eukprot:1943813-Prymnesium_polylepis.1
MTLLTTCFIWSSSDSVRLARGGLAEPVPDSVEAPACRTKPVMRLANHGWRPSELSRAHREMRPRCGVRNGSTAFVCVWLTQRSRLTAAVYAISDPQSSLQWRPEHSEGN